MADIDVKKALREMANAPAEEEPPAKRASMEKYYSEPEDNDDEGLRVPFALGAGDKGYTYGVGRLEQSKRVGKDSQITGYIDALASRNKGAGSKIEPLGVGVRYQKSFKKGGKVPSASKRADGIAQRGKTKGKIY